MRLQREAERAAERALKQKNAELAALERDTRTVFAYNVPTRADERDIFEFFSQAGKVSDVRIIVDRNSRKSKGFAYVEFDSRDAIPAVRLLSPAGLLRQVGRP